MIAENELKKNDGFVPIGKERNQRTLTSFSMIGLISDSNSFGRTELMKFCTHGSPDVSLSFFTFFVGSSAMIVVVFVRSSVVVNRLGAATSETLLKSTSVDQRAISVELGSNRFRFALRKTVGVGEFFVSSSIFRFFAS